MALAKVAKKTEDESRAEMLEALKNVSEEKNIPVETLIESIEGALVSAYKRAFGDTGTVRIAADFTKNEFQVFAQKLVVQRDHAASVLGCNARRLFSTCPCLSS